MAIKTSTDVESEAELGLALRTARLAQDLDQATLARRANVSLSAVKSLESGNGSTLTTFLRVVRALGREDALDSLRQGGAPRHGRYGTDGIGRQRASARKD